MKRYILGAVLAAGLLVSPLFTSAAGLTGAQIESILSLLSSFGVDSATIANVNAILTGGAPTNMPTGTAVSGADKYFGYAYSAFAEFGNYIQENRGHANVAMVGSYENGNNDAASDIAKIREASDNCQKSILVVWPVFFNPDDISLYPDYQERWNRYADAIAPYSGDIIAFYVVEEPYHNARLKNLNLSEAEINSRLEAAATAIKERFPQAKIIQIFGYNELTSPSFDNHHPALQPADPHFKIPSGYDWIGFDFYFSNYYGARRAGGEAGPSEEEFRQFKKYYDHFLFILKSKMTPSQRLVFVPDAYQHSSEILGSDGKTYDYQVPESELLRIPQFYFDKAASEPKTILVAPFLYASAGDMTGLAGLPHLREIYDNYGAAVAGTCERTRGADVENTGAVTSVAPVAPIVPVVPAPTCSFAWESSVGVPISSLTVPGTVIASWTSQNAVAGKWSCGGAISGSDAYNAAYTTGSYSIIFNASQTGHEDCTITVRDSAGVENTCSASILLTAPH